MTWSLIFRTQKIGLLRVIKFIGRLLLWWGDGGGGGADSKERERGNILGFGFMWECVSNGGCQKMKNNSSFWKCVLLLGGFSVLWGSFFLLRFSSSRDLHCKAYASNIYIVIRIFDSFVPSQSDHNKEGRRAS